MCAYTYVCVTLCLQVGYSHDSQITIGHIADAEGVHGGAGDDGSRGGCRGGGGGELDGAELQTRPAANETWIVSVRLIDAVSVAE